ncbi:MAG: SCP2 sterol-binding domain-containing protein, partial [Lachnospiraceae bacterium]|nr:SCP2 sterol-binding domain-containing protein [Lachnospiraceae bacterium]
MTYEQIVKSAKKALAKVDVSKADQVAIQVDIVGEGEGAFYVKVQDGTLAIEPYEYYDHDAKLIVSGKDCVDLFNGKLDAVKAYEAGKITVEGNLESVLKLKDLIPAKAAAAKKTAVKKTTAKKTTTKKTTAKKSTAAKTTTAKAEVKAAEKKTAAKPAAKTTEKKTAAKPAAKTAEKKTAAK